MSAHSNIGPSSAERWMNCPGSVALSEQCPKLPTSVYAAEGTVAHTLAEELVSGKIDELELMGRLGENVICDGHEIEITEEMIDGAIQYRDVIEADYAELVSEDRPTPVARATELRVRIQSIADDLWGTADFLQFRKGHRLIVYDYKFGKGKAVEVVENPQAALYVLGAMETVAGEAFDEIWLVIVQPRAPHADGRVRRWLASKAWLKQFRADAHAAVLETKKPDAKIVAGSWCRWCAAQSICPVIQKEVAAQTQADFTAIAPSETEIKAGQLRGLPSVEHMPIEKVAQALDWEDAIQAWYGAIRARAQGTLESGGVVPGYKLVDGRSNRKWADETGESAAALFGTQYGEKVYETKVLSPAKMEKLVGKNKIPAELIVKPEAPKKIAKDSDPRGVAATTAQQDFDPLKAGAVPALEAPAVEEEDPLGIPSTRNLEKELLGTPPKKRGWPR